MDDTDWKPPEFREHKTDSFSFEGRQREHLDSDMNCICIILNGKIRTMLSEGAKTIELQWVNIVDRNNNPDGVLGTILIKATR